jgi:hypothetical protein
MVRYMAHTQGGFAAFGHAYKTWPRIGLQTEKAPARWPWRLRHAIIFR